MESKTEKRTKLDTKGHCFFCLQSCVTKGNVKGVGRWFSFKFLRRYLQLKFEEENDNFELKEGGEPEVFLCWKCFSLSDQFRELYQQFDMIKMCLNVVIQRINDVMKGADKDEDKVKKYQAIIKKNNSSMSVVEELRRETMNKSGKLGKRVYPQVKLERIKVTKVQNRIQPNIKAFEDESSPPPQDLDSDEEFPSPTSDPLETTMDIICLDNEKGTVSVSNSDDIISPADNSFLTNDTTEITTTTEKGSEHSKSANNPFECSQCQQTFASSTSLRYHKISFHISQFFQDHKDPRISSEEFETLVRKVFQNYECKKVDNKTMCTHCDNNALFSKKSQFYAHLISVHNPNLVSQVKSLQMKHFLKRKEVGVQKSTMSTEPPQESGGGKKRRTENSEPPPVVPTPTQIPSVVAQQLPQIHPIPPASFVPPPFPVMLPPPLPMLPPLPSPLGEIPPHFLLQTETTNVQCFICSLIFANDDILQIHQVTAHRNKVFESYKDCRLSPEAFLYCVNKSLQNKIKAQTQDNYCLKTCLYCGNSFPQTFNLEAHIIRAHFNSFICELIEVQKQLYKSSPSTNPPEEGGNSQQGELQVKREQQIGQHFIVGL